MKIIQYIIPVIFLCLSQNLKAATGPSDRTIPEVSENSEPVYQIVATRELPAASAEQGKAYLYLDTKGRVLTSLTAQYYDGVLRLASVETIDLIPLLHDNLFSSPQVIEIPWQLNRVFRIFGRYQDNEENMPLTPYYENDRPVVYVSDMNSYRTGTSYGSIYIDKAYGGNGKINITGQEYAKGFGIHCKGWMEVSIPTGIYDRFKSDAGKQRGQPYNIECTLAMNGHHIATTGVINNSKKAEWNYAVADSVTRIRIDLLEGGDGNGNDHGAIGAPRLYPVLPVRQQQTLEWAETEVIYKSKPFRQPLTAVSASGLPVFYHIVKGSEYAAIESGNQLSVYRLPDNDSIIIEAFQPGDIDWAPSEIKRCVFHLTKGRVVQRDERIELENGEDLEELIVYADATSAGQVTVKNGLVKIKKMIFKYQFTPRKWNFISFPSDLNIDKISNLNELGYYQNGKISGKGAYFISYYDTQTRAETPAAQVWKNLDTPMVKGLQGYIMGINDAQGLDSREVTFTIDNVSLDFESTLRLLNLTLDMTYTEPNTTQTVYISPANVKGNTLKVDVLFSPENPESLPVNFSRALEDARITFTPNREGIRLTLPDPTPAKILIYDRKMRKLQKAIRYVSPMMIDISDLKAGTYQMIVSYGNATAQKSFEK
ncbi:MAG: NPCBM/NEW2 domain-containing protein [Bacteroidales bacterium]